MSRPVVTQQPPRGCFSQSRIAGQLPALRDLSLAGNPCALQQHYKATIASSCQSLKLLDGAPLAAVVVGTDVVWPLPLGVNFERNNTQQRLVEGGQEIPAGVRQPLLAGCSTAPANRTEALDYPNNGVEPAAPSDPRPSRWLSSASDGPLKPASLTAAKDLVSPAPLENFRDGAVGRPALPQVLQAFGSQAERWPASEAGVRHPPRAVASQQPEDPFDNSKRFVEDEARAEGPSDRLKNRQHECGAGGGSQTVHKPRYGSEIQRARDMLSEALADADGQRRLAEERKAELEVATQKVVEAERSLSSLRAYIGVMAGKGGGSEGCPQVQEAGVQADERSDDGAVMEKELLGQQLAAMREIVAVQEEHMAVGGDGLLERWRQEVFKCIVARRASEVRLDEEVRTAKAREARLREELRKTNCAVQVLSRLGPSLPYPSDHDSIPGAVFILLVVSFPGFASPALSGLLDPLCVAAAFPFADLSGMTLA